jgi:alpha-pyrone synthase
MPDRHPEFAPPTNPSDQGPSVGDRMRIYERECAPLALRSSKQALEQSGVPSSKITHVITVSCSGFYAPGVDIALIKGLGLRPTVQRVHIGYMGCYAVINAMRVAQGIAGSDPGARILLCAVELCSLHYHYGKRPEHIVANALFSDGSAAAVVAPRQHPGDDTWCVTDTGSCLLPESGDAMTWRIFDHGFEMTLSNQVPKLIATHLPGWLNGWLGKHGLNQDDINTWAVHPGGPRILTAVTDALGLPREVTNVSLDVLREHGNMSSPTILFVLDRLLRQNAPRPCVALGFGPGLMAEAMLFK